MCWGWVECKKIQPFMDPSSNALESSMRGWNKFCCSAFHGTPKFRAWVLHERSGTRFPYSASNFWCQKLEAEQTNFPQTLLKIRAPKLEAFKCAKISWNLFPKYSFSFLCNFISLVCFFCKVMSILEVHLHRYILFFHLHIMLSNYASYFLSHLIIFCRFHHLWEVLSWLNRGW
jgi:hypothetical protein